MKEIGCLDDLEIGWLLDLTFYDLFGPLAGGWDLFFGI
jgi:hypothetical protein